MNLDDDLRLAAGLSAKGELVAAEATYRRVLEADPSNGKALHGIGLVLRERGQFDKALATFARLSEHPEASVESYIDAAVTAAKLGQRQSAEQWLIQGATRFPDRYEPMYFLGSMHEAAGRDAEALSCLDRAAALRPVEGEVYKASIRLLRRNRRLADAASLARQWEKHTPKDPAAPAALAHILLDQNRTEDALQASQRAIKRAPDDVDLVILIARIFLLLERPDDCLAALARASSLAPERADVWVHLGSTLKILGRVDEAEAALRRVLLSDPGNETAFFELAEIVSFKKDQALVERMENCLDAAKSARQPVSAKLHFALGKAYDETDRPDLAFEHFAAANDLERRSHPFDEKLILDEMRQFSEIFTKAFLDRSPAACPQDRAIFIVGMPRSGSTLIEQILASHPDVAALGEQPHFREAARSVLDTPILSGMGRLESREFALIGERYIASVSPLARKRPRFADKMLANAVLAGAIHMALPNARIVHCVRDPLDTCLSCYMKAFGPRVPYSSDLKWLGHFYRAQARLMAHWRAVLPAEVFLEVQYENVVRGLEGEARRLLAHCDLDWNERALRPHETERAVNTASVVQVRLPLYDAAIGRWKRYERHLGPLVSALEETLP